eukprot:scaffold533_cov369-Prasinococcus_capsulatus_cf.AAC.27
MSGGRECSMSPCSARLAYGQEGCQLLVLLHELLVLERHGEGLFVARNVHQSLVEASGCFQVVPQHHVAEAHIVEERDAAGHYTSIHALGAHINGFHSLHGPVVISQQTVHASQSNDGEVTKRSAFFIATLSVTSLGKLIAVGACVSQWAPLYVSVTVAYLSTLLPPLRS